MRLVRAEFLKLRKRRGLAAAATVLTLAPIVVGFVVLTIMHAVDPEKYGPAGGFENLQGSLELLTQIGIVAATLVGATAGAGDRGAGVFRELVVTGRSRLQLFRGANSGRARVPASFGRAVVRNRGDRVRHARRKRARAGDGRDHRSLRRVGSSQHGHRIPARTGCLVRARFARNVDRDSARLAACGRTAAAVDGQAGQRLAECRARVAPAGADANRLHFALRGDRRARFLDARTSRRGRLADEHGRCLRASPAKKSTKGGC